MNRSTLWILAILLVAASVSFAGGETESAATSDAALENMNETGLPIVQEKVALSMVARKRYVNGDFDTMPFNLMMEERTNVAIDWEAIPESQYEEKKNLLLASGDLPDAFFGPFALNVNDLVKYGPQDVFIDHTELIEAWAPRIVREMEKHPIMRAAATAPDGRIYAIPRPNVVGVVEGRDNLFLYKPWLDQLGLQVPETIDEFRTVLMAFKTQDPNGNGKADEIPFTNIYADYNKSIGSLFGAFGMVDNVQHMVVIDDEVIYTPLTAEWRDAVSYFHEFYAEGLFDPEAFTQDKKQYAAKGRQEPQVVGATITWNNFDLPGGNNQTAADWITVGPLTGADGVKRWSKFNGNNGGISFTGFTVTNVNQYPEISMRWVDEFFDKKIGAQAAQGPIGINLYETESGSLDYLPDPPDMSHTEFRFGNTPGDTPYAFWPEDWGAVLPRPVHAQKKFEDINTYYADYMIDGFPGIMWTPDESRFLQSTGTDIVEFVREQMAKWLLNGGIEDEWESFKTRLHDMGIDRYIEIHQTGYDRFKQS